MEEQMLISTSDIADLVEERLPVVSTWRNRFKTGENAFPEPVGGTPARPLFDFQAVHEWVSRNRPDKNLQVGLLRIRVWSALRPLSERFNQFDLVYWLHQELHVRKRSLLFGIDPTNDPEAARGDEYLRKLLGSGTANAVPEPNNPDWPAAIKTIKSLVFTATSTELVEVSDFALGRLSAGHGRSGGHIGAVGSNVSAILAAAATSLVTDDVVAPVIYDPACGIGETLIQSYELLGRPGRVLGTEINVRVAAVASIRLALRNIPATINSADTLSTLQFEGQRPDLVVAEPPLGLQWIGVWNPEDPRSLFGVPPARNADLAWIEDAASRLEGSATGLVLTSMGALGNGGAEERVRANLILRGAVRAIIALPPNLLQYTSMALALWVLRPPSGDNVGLPVLIVDASNPSTGEAGAAKRADWVRTSIADWVARPRDLDTVEGVLTASVEIKDLVASAFDLTPSRWTAEPISDHLSADLEGFSFTLEKALQKFQPVAPDFVQLPAAPHIVTIREMTEFAEAREAKLWTGRGTPGDEAPADMITSDRFLDVGRFTLGRRRPDDETEPGFRTKPGDIVFFFRPMGMTGTRVQARVDSEGGHRLGNGVHALRLLPPSRFDPEYVALCLAGGWNQRHQKGATTKRARPGDLEIPLLELDAQRRWTEAYTLLQRTVGEAEEIVESAANLDAAAESFLRFGHTEAK